MSSKYKDYITKIESSEEAKNKTKLLMIEKKEKTDKAVVSVSQKDKKKAKNNSSEKTIARSNAKSAIIAILIVVFFVAALTIPIVLGLKNSGGRPFISLRQQLNNTYVDMSDIQAFALTKKKNSSQMRLSSINGLDEINPVVFKAITDYENGKEEDEENFITQEELVMSCTGLRSVGDFTFLEFDKNHNHSDIPEGEIPPYYNFETSFVIHNESGKVYAMSDFYSNTGSRKYENLYRIYENCFYVSCEKSSNWGSFIDCFKIYVEDDQLKFQNSIQNEDILISQYQIPFVDKFGNMFIPTENYENFDKDNKVAYYIGEWPISRGAAIRFANRTAYYVEYVYESGFDYQLSKIGENFEKSDDIPDDIILRGGNNVVNFVGNIAYCYYDSHTAIYKKNGNKYSFANSIHYDPIDQNHRTFGRIPFKYDDKAMYYLNDLELNANSTELPFVKLIDFKGYVNIREDYHDRNLLIVTDMTLTETVVYHIKIVNDIPVVYHEEDIIYGEYEIITIQPIN